MSEDRSYNGWTNYETWNVALWLNNDQGSQEMAHEIVRDNPEDWKAGDALKDALQELMPDLGATMWADLLGAAFSEVNWREIAENFRDDLDEQ